MDREWLGLEAADVALGHGPAPEGLDRDYGTSVATSVDTHRCSGDWAGRQR
jgi:hypothetical protein